MPWNQIYDPFGNRVLSTLLAALPVLVLLGSLASLRIKAHLAALAGLGSALAVAVLVFGMPVGKAVAASLFGAAYGLFPISWIILNVIFLYNLADEKGHFKVLRDSLTGITGDRRLQLLLIAFCFGAFFEGACGFGTPVAVTSAILIGLGFSPLVSSGLSLVANSAAVAFGSLGTPIVALAGITGIDILKLSAMVGRQLPGFAIIVPFWLIWAYAGFGGMIEVWPALLTAGVAFAVPLFLISNYHGPWLAGVGASVVSIFALVGLLLVWKPKRIWRHDGASETGEAHPRHAYGNAAVLKAWLPWLILSVVIFIWGIPQVKAFLDGIFSLKIPVPDINGLISRIPPIVPAPAPERAVFAFNALSFSGTGIFVAAVISAFVMGCRLREAAAVWRRTLRRVRFSLLTVTAMLALGYVIRYSGLDATLGLAFAGTGVLYPFFGTLLGWLGVALTGSVTSSNVLFGSLQTISAGRLGLNPVLMASANSTGGVMGKMIDAQSIVFVSTATKLYGSEGKILRYVFFHSLALASLVGLLVTLQAYVDPFVRMVIK